MKKEDILAFIKSKIHAVITTVSADQNPEAALVGFGQTDDLELIIGTNSSTRKYKNISENNRVAFVIGLGEDGRTVQYEGIARELKAYELGKHLGLYHAKIPSAAKYRSDEGQVYFLISPTWIRYTDVSNDKEFEFRFS